MQLRVRKPGMGLSYATAVTCSPAFQRKTCVHGSRSGASEATVRCKHGACASPGAAAERGTRCLRPRACVACAAEMLPRLSTRQQQQGAPAGDAHWVLARCSAPNWGFLSPSLCVERESVEPTIHNIHNKLQTRAVLLHGRDAKAEAQHRQEAQLSLAPRQTGRGGSSNSKSRKRKKPAKA